MAYYLLLENEEFVSYEENENGFEIIPTSYWSAYTFEKWEEAKIEEKRINMGRDEEGKIYKTKHRVSRILKIEEVTSEDKKEEIKQEIILSDNEGNIFYRGADDVDEVTLEIAKKIQEIKPDELKNEYGINHLEIQKEILYEMFCLQEQKKNKKTKQEIEEIERQIDENNYKLKMLIYNYKEKFIYKEKKKKKEIKYGILKREEDKYKDKLWYFNGFEYRKTYYSETSVLESLAEEGWELISVSGDKYYFKKIV